MILLKGCDRLDPCWNDLIYVVNRGEIGRPTIRGEKGVAELLINIQTRAWHVLNPEFTYTADCYVLSTVESHKNGFLMSGRLDLNLLLGDTMCADCTEEWGPPPDNILEIPPPPFPNFIGVEPQNESALCSSCVWAPSGNPGVEFIELPRQGTTTNDTWLLLVGASSLGVLVLGALFAFLLLKCRARLACKSPVPHIAVSVKAKGCESVLYPYPVASQDGRVLWAAVTARGTTQHFTAPLPVKPSLPPPDPPVTFDNTGFVDSDSQMPLMESYQLSELVDSDSTSSSGTLRPRPRVSSPTRIEHPNLPPLNALPHRTLRRSTIHRREMNASTCPSSL